MTLPSAFLNSMRDLLGAEVDTFLRAMEEPATTAVRLHPTKGQGLFPEGTPIPWSTQGRFLAKRPSFTLDPHLHAGAYYVQDASSQFVEACVLRARELGAFAERPIPVILDLCAAPGGKTTHLASLLPEGVVWANEVVRHRASILVENIHKWGMPNVLVTSGDPRDLGKSPLMVDMLVVDAPCSGEGLFRKDPRAVEEWSPVHVTHCALRDRRILGDIWPLLRPGGFLLFSTCTWNREENEQVVTWIEEELGAQRMSVVGAEDARESVYRFLPQHGAGEGFTCALLQKTGGTVQLLPKVAYKEYLLARDLLLSHLQNAQEFVPLLLHDLVSAVPRSMAPLAAALERFRIRPLSAGAPLAQQHGHRQTLSLHPMLAHSTVFVPAALHEVALSRDQALDYLRRRDVQVESGEGRVVVTFAGNRLGFAKAQHSRLNSQYPMAYRIARL